MQLDPWPPCLDVGLYWIEKRGEDAGIEKRWWIIQRKKVRIKKSATSYETVAVLPLAGLCFLAVKLAVEEENELSRRRTSLLGVQRSKES